MPQTLLCPQCQAALPDDSPGGVCPACLLNVGMAGGSEIDAASAESHSGASHPDESQPDATPAALGRWSEPSIEELARRLPQLEILEILGRGGMGAVYKARQVALDRLVAVKVLPPAVGRDAAFSERFVREAKALARLAHPNIVTVFDFGKSGETCYLVMEYVDGVNLRRAIQARSLSPEQALGVVPQICDALQYAHDEGVVHRDIKPENILLDSKGRVKIADFGLAKLLRRSTPELALTATHQIMGTLHYMAPEQLENPLSVDHRADIYSLGVVFYELLTGQLPLGRFALPSEKASVDQRLDEVVLKTLEREPDRRYQHASEVKTHVQTIRTGPAVSGGRAENRQRLDPAPAPNAAAKGTKLQTFLLLAGVGMLALVPIACVASMFTLAQGPALVPEAIAGFSSALVFLLAGAATITASFLVARSQTRERKALAPRQPWSSPLDKPPVATFVGKPPPAALPHEGQHDSFTRLVEAPNAGERAVRWPARLLWLVGALSFGFYVALGVGLLLGIAFGDSKFRDPPLPPLVLGAGAVLGVFYGAVLMYGASRLRHRTAAGWVIVAVVLAILPLAPIPIWPLGVIAGLCSLLVMRKTSVKLDFARGMTEEEEWLAARGARRTRLAAIAASLALLTCAGLTQFGPGLVPRPVGAVLTYEAVIPPGDDVDAEALREAVRMRVNPVDSPVARVSFLEDRSVDASTLEISIDVFGRDAATANRIEERLAARGEIELRALAHASVDAQAAAAASDLLTYRSADGEEPATSRGEEKARWLPVAPHCVPAFLDVFGKVQTFFVTRRSAAGQLEALVLVDEFHIGREDIARIEAGDYGRGVRLSFNSSGAEKMRRFTSRPEYAAKVFDNEIRRLAIIIDDQIFLLRPMGEITTDQLNLGDHWTQPQLSDDESRGLLAILKTGPLPVKLTPTGRTDLE